MDISRNLLQQYNGLCDYYDYIYKIFHSLSIQGRSEQATIIVQELRKIEAQISKVMEQLDQFETISDYNRDRGNEILEYTKKLEQLIESARDAKFGKEENGENKYSNNGFVDTRDIPIKDVKRAAEAWGEGYKPLIDLLEECIKNQLRTYGCCAGHNESDQPYVMFDGEDERVIQLAEYVAKNKICDKIGVFKKNDLDRVMISMSTNMDNRDKFFSMAKKFIDEGEKSDEFALFNRIVDFIKKFKDGDQVIAYDVNEERYKITIDSKFIYLIKSEIEDCLLRLEKNIVTGKKISIIQRIKIRCASSLEGLGQIMNVKNIIENAMNRDVSMDERNRD